jgi:phosphocarrier protein HPr
MINDKVLTKVKVLLKNMDNVEKFVEITNKFNFDIDVIGGKRMVNGKSVLGLLTLDLTSPLSVILNTNKSNEINEFINLINDFKI